MLAIYTVLKSLFKHPSVSRRTLQPELSLIHPRLWWRWQPKMPWSVYEQSIPPPPVKRIWQELQSSIKNDNVHPEKGLFFLSTFLDLHRLWSSGGRPACKIYRMLRGGGASYKNNGGMMSLYGKNLISQQAGYCLLLYVTCDFTFPNTHPPFQTRQKRENLEKLR